MLCLISWSIEWVNNVHYHFAEWCGADSNQTLALVAQWLCVHVVLFSIHLLFYILDAVRPFIDQLLLSHHSPHVIAASFEVYMELFWTRHVSCHRFLFDAVGSVLKWTWLMVQCYIAMDSSSHCLSLSCTLRCSVSLWNVILFRCVCFIGPLFQMFFGE